MRFLRSPLASPAVALLLLTACSGGDGTSSTSPSGGDSSTTDATVAASTGAGGGAASSTASGASTVASTGAGGATGAGGGGSGGAVPGEAHVLISELGVQPAGGEFIELTNPTAVAVDLTDYYLSDNSNYPAYTGAAWSPITTNPGTDFLVGFPSGAMLAAGQSIVIATDPTFVTTYNKCPDYILATTQDLTCPNGVAKAMRAPAGADPATKPGSMLSNDREMVIVFRWDGTTNKKDVDYITWGAAFEAGTRVDKTALAGYAPDTAPANQKPALPAPLGQSAERCDPTEPGETKSGGNGVTGHDETSEDLGAAFKLSAAPTPGAVNGCK